MRIGSKWLLGVVAAMALAPGAGAAEKVVLYGDDDYAPYSFVEGGEFKGIYVEVLKKAAEKLAPAYLVELKPVPWKRGLNDLETGASLGLFPPYLKKERTFIQPYSVPLYREAVVLFCNEETMKTPRKSFPEDYAGVKIGINSGFSLSDKLMAAGKAGTVKIEETKGNDANLKKLATNRIGCYANDRGSILYTAKKLKSSPELANLKLVEAAELSGEDAFIGYSAGFKAAYKADFIEKMNAALEEIKKSDGVKKAVEAYTK